MGCEDGLGLCIAIDLPGDHGEGVLGESVMVESFSGVVVVDGPVGGFSGLVLTKESTERSAGTLGGWSTT